MLYVHDLRSVSDIIAIYSLMFADFLLHSVVIKLYKKVFVKKISFYFIDTCLLKMLKKSI